MSVDLADLLWPRAEAPVELEVKLPAVEEGSRVPAIVHAEARASLDRQNTTWSSLDDKASTVIAAVLVVVGLTLPNLTLRTDVEKWLFIALAVVVGYGLLCAVASYNVHAASSGWTPKNAVDALVRWKNPDAGLAALAVHLLRAVANNKPVVERKARLVRRALLSLAVAALVLGSLFVAGSFSVSSPG